MLSRFRLRRTGVAPRLLAAVAIPLVFLSFVTVNAVLERSEQADRADELVAEANTLIRLVRVSEALFSEQLLANSTTGDARTGRAVEAQRSMTDTALHAIAAHDRPVSDGALLRVRQMVDSGTFETAIITSRFDELRSQAHNKIVGSVDRASGRAVDLGRSDISDRVLRLDAIVDAGAASARQVTSLNNLWSSATFEADFARSDLAAASASWLEASERVRSTADDGLTEDWDSLEMRSSEFLRTVRRALAGDDNGFDPYVVAEGAIRTGSINRIAPVYAEALGSTVRSVQAEHNTASQRAMWMMLASIVISVGAALWLGRSIVRPLRRLTDTAVHVAEGELHVDSLPLQGPPDLVSAAGAFNDLVANLQLMEQKSTALADGALDSAILARKLPGALGETLERSVQVLSESIIASDRLQAQLEHDATHDMLTGVANRAGVYAQINDIISAGVGSTTVGWVVFVDLDDFKWINDTYGHAAGDSVLRTVAQRMTEVVGPSGFVGRLGGDEFTVVVSDMDATDDPIAVAERLVSAASLSISVAETEVSVGACAGVAAIDREESAEQLLRRADLAVYEAKRRGAAMVASYDESLEEKMLTRAEISDALQHSLRHNSDLSLVYQPILDADGGALVGVEALVRWNRPGHGPVPPDLFVGVAESSRLIVDLDRWVLTQALLEMSRITQAGAFATMHVSVNLSGRHLVHPDLIADVEAALLLSGFDPTRLVLEVTETVLVTDLERAAEQLARLRDLGIRISIDDFGTGYTSLAHLRAMPVDTLKIDRSFVTGLGSENDESDLVAIVCDLARQLGVSTVGEGVETEIEARVLRDLGCTYLQGYLYAKPMPAADFVSWVRNRGHGAISGGVVAATTSDS